MNDSFSANEKESLSQGIANPKMANNLIQYIILYTDDH